MYIRNEWARNRNNFFFKIKYTTATEIFQPRNCRCTLNNAIVDNNFAPPGAPYWFILSMHSVVFVPGRLWANMITYKTRSSLPNLLQRRQWKTLHRNRQHVGYHYLGVKFGYSVFEIRSRTERQTDMYVNCNTSHPDRGRYHCVSSSKSDVSSSTEVIIDSVDSWARHNNLSTGYRPNCPSFRPSMQGQALTPYGHLRHQTLRRNSLRYSHVSQSRFHIQLAFIRAYGDVHNKNSSRLQKHTKHPIFAAFLRPIHCV